MKIGIAIPTLNESANLMKILPLFSKNDYIVVISNDISRDDTVEIAKSYGAFVPYHYKREGLGRSWKEAITTAWYSFDCDYVVEMDADHNPFMIPIFIKELEEKNIDVIVGKEMGEWQMARRVTGFLCRYGLGLKLEHPTCGFIAWKSDILAKIPWKHVKSNGDMFHVELLFWAKKLGAKIKEMPIPEQPGKRRYGFKRVAIWLLEYFRVCRLKYLWFWRWRGLEKRSERLLKFKSDSVDVETPRRGATRRERLKRRDG